MLLFIVTLDKSIQACRFNGVNRQLFIWSLTPKLVERKTFYKKYKELHLCGLSWGVTSQNKLSVANQNKFNVTNQNKLNVTKQN